MRAKEIVPQPRLEAAHRVGLDVEHAARELEEVLRVGQLVGL